MNKKMIAVTAAGIVALIAAVGSSIYASQSAKPPLTERDKRIIGQTFDEIQSYAAQQGTSPSERAPLVNSEHFQISAERFFFYKKNIEMAAELNLGEGAKAATFSDAELLDLMIKKELTVQYAKEAGITATDEEIGQMIDREKNMLYDPSVSGANKETVQELMAHRIRMTGMSEDEFWQSEDTRAEYAKTIYIGKLMQQLSQDGTFTDTFGMDEFQDRLLADARDRYTVDWSVLEAAGN
ncbi:SurA N-terminal domain-containing protein [Paenibacillus sp. MSJ-34]|uniref:SurA N-terminal domain-containing protein n=1 Tax=Paenibacillus sp. MSJ-34 TaxID=2841529 RepID=UPI001C107CAB|nr:SurA N-terminal domain-containing protein [Paenibacillus sp. MSJ-34]MBU5444825.1 SurA N-terminal domain-containing protein [Paenibacillus sp. MSJ-34]